MSNKIKVEKALEVIQSFGLEDVFRNPEEVYKDMRNVELFELAELITDMSNTINKVREILEDEL